MNQPTSTASCVQPPNSKTEKVRQREKGGGGGISNFRFLRRPKSLPCSRKLRSVRSLDCLSRAVHYSPLSFQHSLKDFDTTSCRQNGNTTHTLAEVHTNIAKRSCNDDKPSSSLPLMYMHGGMCTHVDLALMNRGRGGRDP